MVRAGSAARSCSVSRRPVSTSRSWDGRVPRGRRRRGGPRAGSPGRGSGRGRWCHRCCRSGGGRAEDELGGIDLLVNNAGRIDAEVPLWEADPDEWWSVMETNLRGPFLLSRGGPRDARTRWGRVVDLSSGAGSHDMNGASAYNASKTALLRMGSNLHLSGHALGLRTFEVSPGVVQTDLTESMDMHVGRTEWTPVERTVEMVVAIARGELDAWSGTFVRVTHDTRSCCGPRPRARRSGGRRAGSRRASPARDPLR
ncbi:SDR family oxidoreductase [Oerskovia sp. M15]